MFNALDICIWLVCSAVCGILAPYLIQGLERQRAQARGKTLPYEKWPVKRTVLLVIVFAACTLLCALSYDAPQAAIASALLYVGVSCAVIDLDMRLIPNQLVAAIAALGIALRASCGVESLLYGLGVAVAAFVLLMVCSLVSRALTGKMGMGGGDLKLLVAACLATGWPGVLFMVVGFAAVVAMMALYQLLYLRLGLKSMFPMAPAIVTGLIFGVVYLAISSLSGVVPL